MENEQFELLLKLTSIRSEPLINAAKDVLVGGLSQRDAAGRHGVNEGLLSRRLTVLENTEKTVIKLVAFYSS